MRKYTYFTVNAISQEQTGLESWNLAQIEALDMSM